MTDSNGRVVLFIDEIHTVVGAGATSGAMDAGNLLKPMLGRGELRCIGATTLDEYRQHIEKDPALERRFQQVLVDQPSVVQTISILRGLRERYELHHGVRISDNALVEAANLADRRAPLSHMFSLADCIQGCLNAAECADHRLAACTASGYASGIAHTTRRRSVVSTRSSSSTRNGRKRGRVATGTSRTASCRTRRST